MCLYCISSSVYFHSWSVESSRLSRNVLFFSLCALGGYSFSLNSPGRNLMFYPDCISDMLYILMWKGLHKCVSAVLTWLWACRDDCSHMLVCVHACTCNYTDDSSLLSIMNEVLNVFLSRAPLMGVLWGNIVHTHPRLPQHLQMTQTHTHLSL